VTRREHPELYHGRLGLGAVALLGQPGLAAGAVPTAGLAGFPDVGAPYSSAGINGLTPTGGQLYH